MGTTAMNYSCILVERTPLFQPEAITRYTLLSLFNGQNDEAMHMFEISQDYGAPPFSATSFIHPCCHICSIKKRWV